MTNFLRQNNMTEFATIVSTRRKFTLNEFTIDLDSTNFGYGIGEVEIMVSSQEEVRKTV
jgi:adenylate cyclase class IV